MCVLPTDSATTHTHSNSNAVFSHISRDQIISCSLWPAHLPDAVLCVLCVGKIKRQSIYTG